MVSPASHGAGLAAQFTGIAVTNGDIAGGFAVPGVLNGVGAAQALAGNETRFRSLVTNSRC